MSFEELESVRKHALGLTHQYWLQHSLFTWQWWALLAFVVLPWGICWLCCNKKRLTEMMLYGTFIAIICVMLDITGTDLGLWAYPKQLVWFCIPPIIPLDLCILPVEHMLVYQYFPRWKWFVAALTVTALLNAFVAEPVFVWAGIYKLYTWRYIYSVPIYIAKGIVVKIAVQQMMKHERRMRMAGDKS